MWLQGLWSSHQHKALFDNLRLKNICLACPQQLLYLNLNYLNLYSRYLTYFVLCLLKRSSHTFSGSPDQRGAGGSGAAGLRRATRTGGRLRGRGPGRAAKETGWAQGPECSQQSAEAGAAPVRTDKEWIRLPAVHQIKADSPSAVHTHFISTTATQVGEGGDAQAGAEAEGQGVGQRGHGGIPAHHGSQTEETHSDQEGEGPGVESAEGEGKHPQAAGWIEEGSGWRETDSLDRPGQLLRGQWTCVSVVTRHLQVCHLRGDISVVVFTPRAGRGSFDLWDA